MDAWTGVAPLLIEKLRRVHAAMAALGFPMRATEGLRTVARQKELYAQGRTTPGPIVTMNDGVLHPSNHQAKPQDALGHAIDSCFLGTDPYLEHLSHADSMKRWGCFGLCVEAVGLRWGGRFPKFDGPHAELP
jgi:peptidoglycan L-alanyl-D-glutamate endopeptidase CwlK